MKRSAALHIALAIKKLRIAERNAGMWTEAIGIQKTFLEKCLLAAGHLDLLDSTMLADLDRDIASERRKKDG